MRASARGAALLPLTFAACAAPVTPSVEALVPADDEAWRPADPEPVYDAAAFERIVADAVAVGIPEFGRLGRAVTDLFDAGTPECPGEAYRSYTITVYDPAGCTTEAGYWYEGAGALALDLVDAERDGVAESFVARLKMDMSAADPEGNRLRVGGDSTLEATLGEQGPVAVAGTLAGTYRWDADPGWLGRGVSVLLAYAATYDADVATASLDGGYTVADQPPIGFDDLALGGACGARPTGAVLVRDDAGRWYRLDFDPASCDGCGALSFDRGTDLGRACVDVADAVRAAAASAQGWTAERLVLEELPP